MAVLLFWRRGHLAPFFAVARRAQRPENTNGQCGQDSLWHVGIYRVRHLDAAIETRSTPQKFLARKKYLLARTYSLVSHIILV